MMNEANINMTKAEQLLFQEIKSLHKKIDKLAHDKVYESIEEISLGKAAKLMHRGEAALVELVKKKKLRGMPYKTNSGETRYRFRLSDIKDFQNRAKEKHEEIVFVESAESIAKRIFKGGKGGNN